MPYLDHTVLDMKERIMLIFYRLRNARTEKEATQQYRKVRKEAKIYELSGPDVMATNDFDNPERIRIKDKTIKNISPGFNYVFPAYSATIIEVKVK